MEKKKTKRVLLYSIPFVIQVIIHMVASYIALVGGDSILWHIIRAGIVTVFSMILGEGYGSLALFIAGFYDRAGVYIAVIVLSITSAVANLVGFNLAGIEGYPCLWMTFVFWGIDLFLFVFAIKKLNDTYKRKRKKA